MTSSRKLLRPVSCPTAINTTSAGTGYKDKLWPGLYGAVGLGASRLEPNTSEVPDINVNDRVEPAGQITVGADLTKHLSVEAHSADLGSAGFSPAGRINYHISGVSALIYAGRHRDRHSRQDLSAFGRIGVGSLENTPVGAIPFAQDNATHLLFGAGIEYMTRYGMGLRLEGVSFDQDAQYVQLGLMLRPGRKREGRRQLPAVAVSQP